jgi:hypothetical protein
MAADEYLSETRDRAVMPVAGDAGSKVIPHPTAPALSCFSLSVAM